MAKTVSKSKSRVKSPGRKQAKPVAARRKIKATRAPRKGAKKRAAHRFVVSHHNEADFQEGLRSYAKYRDLGIADATEGMVRAHVIRFAPPFRPEEVSIPHYHNVDFQMIYVLKGWITSEFEGQGAHTMHAGACWIQPPSIVHTVLDYSDDCEVLEVILPADFATVTVAEEG